jgi:RecA-family ATPase
MSATVTQIPTARRPVPFEPFSPTKWHGREPPQLDWIVDGCFLRGTVAMLNGDGGLGKSLLMQQLTTAAAIGLPWLGLTTKACKTFAMFCEDDEDELERRQAAINEHYGVENGDLDKQLYISRVGQENVLAEFDRRSERLAATALYEALHYQVTDFGAQLVIIDTVADVFAGDEIRRNQVRRFITLLRSLAVKIQGTVILTAHPSLAGLASGTGISGSTAWNNSVRSRLYLTRAKPITDDADEAQEARNERFLKTMKNNQGPDGGRIPLKWESGVFVRTDGQAPGFLERMSAQQQMCAALADLVRNGTMVPADSSARNGFANIIRQQPGCRQISWSAASAALPGLIDSGKIVRVELGPPSKRRVYVRTPNTRYPGEGGADGHLV